MNLLDKAKKLLTTNPIAFIYRLKNISLFYISNYLRPFIFPQKKNANVTFGNNVRLQRISCLYAERPNGKLKIGKNCIIYEKAQIGAYKNGNITIGNDSIIGDAKIMARKSIKLGNRVMTSWNVLITDYEPHPMDPNLRGNQVRLITTQFIPKFGKKEKKQKIDFEWDFPCNDVSIGDDVWLGANSSVLKGAHIGNGCIVATGAVVVKGVYPDNSILAGTPAKVIKTVQTKVDSSNEKK